MNIPANSEPANISISKMRNSVLIYGVVCCCLYIIFFFLMKFIHLMYITELRMVNYVILYLVCLYQIKKWINQNGTYVAFLQVLGTVFYTGVWSFVLFSIFLAIYIPFDKAFAELFSQNIPDIFNFMPSLIILFEGLGASIIVSFIHMQYFRRYEEGEESLKK